MSKDKLQRSDNPEDMGRRKKSLMKVILTVIILILLCLCFRSCRARDEPAPNPDRVYEEDHTLNYEDVIPWEMLMRGLSLWWIGIQKAMEWL